MSEIIANGDCLFGQIADLLPGCQFVNSNEALVMVSPIKSSSAVERGFSGEIPNVEEIASRRLLNLNISDKVCVKATLPVDLGGLEIFLSKTVDIAA
ncbi:hypothetical protein GJ496_008390 [Pomphorhynchus laevis]|nr:hypothetical protein GJ496_008390 [Pomphorhynchus laevis]